MIGDKADAQTKPDKVHDPFTAKSETPHIDWLSYVCEIPDSAVIDFRAGLVRTDDERRVPDIAPY